MPNLFILFYLFYLFMYMKVKHKTNALHVLYIYST